MFQAVRRWWHNERVQRVSRLFAFELTVVMIGVLAAQEVSNWAQRQSSLSEVEDLHGDLYHSYEIYRRIAQSHQFAATCFRQRIDTILERVGDDLPIDAALLAPAKLAGMSPDEISPENFQLLRDRYGDDVTDQIGSVQFNLGVNEKASAAIDRLWYEFQRLDPKHGKVSDLDRAAARDAAVQIKANLAALESSSGLIVQLTDLLGIRSNPKAELRVASSCEEIWRSGYAYNNEVAKRAMAGDRKS
jgi:hypothetical protein